MKKDTSQRLTDLVRNIVRLHSGDPEGYAAAEMPDGTVRVEGPSNVAVYPREAWTTKFTRHLHSGYFAEANAVHGRDPQ